MTAIRVLLADDQALLRESLRMMVDAQPDLQVAGEAADGGQAVQLAARLVPDVVVMDIRMPGMDGIEATRRICAGRPPGTPPKVIVLTTFDLDEYVVAALQAGASGFLLKDAAPADILAGSASCTPARRCSPPRSPDGCWSVSPDPPSPAWPRRLG